MLGEENHVSDQCFTFTCPHKMISILEVQLHKYQGALPFSTELSSFPTELSSLSMELQFTASSHFFRTGVGRTVSGYFTLQDTPAHRPPNSLLSQCTLSCLSGDRCIYLTLPCAGLLPAAWSCAFKCSISVEPLHVPTHMSYVLYFPNYLYTLEADAN